MHRAHNPPRSTLLQAGATRLPHKPSWSVTGIPSSISLTSNTWRQLASTRFDFLSVIGAWVRCIAKKLLSSQSADVYSNSWSRVVRAINWAGEAGIGVLVDLHGAPGSQNGQPHSGISDGQARLFGNETNLRNTVDVLTYLTQQLASVTNVIGIQLINEPNNDPSLADFCKDGHSYPSLY